MKNRDNIANAVNANGMKYVCSSKAIKMGDVNMHSEQIARNLSIELNTITDCAVAVIVDAAVVVDDDEDVVMVEISVCNSFHSIFANCRRTPINR